MNYDVSITATFMVAVHGPNVFRKFWDYVDKKLKDTAEMTEDALDHGYPPAIEILPLETNPNYFVSISMVYLKGCFTFYTLKREFYNAEPDYGFTLVVHPNIPQLEFAEEFPKFMKEIGCEDWSCNTELWRLDALIANIQTLKDRPQ